MEQQHLQESIEFPVLLLLVQLRNTAGKDCAMPVWTSPSSVILRTRDFDLWQRTRVSEAVVGLLTLTRIFSGAARKIRCTSCKTPRTQRGVLTHQSHAVCTSIESNQMISGNHTRGSKPENTTHTNRNINIPNKLPSPPASRFMTHDRKPHGKKKKKQSLTCFLRLGTVWEP